MRAPGHSSLTAVLTAALAGLVLAIAPIAAPAGERGEQRGFPAKQWPRVTYPSDAAVRDAASFAAGRAAVSFAVIDADRGLRGYDPDTGYSSASASKVLLLAAELHRLHSEREPLDSETRDLLEPMITYSDNDAAGAVYARVGDAGMEAAAERAGMRSFGLDPGFWGGAQLTAADLARFYWRLERNFPARHRDYGMRLLANITETQRWGIPAAAGHDWRVWFKGGWRPAGQEGTTGAVTHQGALLVHDGGERLALAVLTNEAPGSGGGYTAIEGVTDRLLAEPPRVGRWPAP